MKKIYTFIIVSVFAFSFANGQQPFALAGAVWHYDVWQIFYSSGYIRIEYTIDTVIGGITCKILQPTEYDIIDIDGHNYYSIDDLNQIYIYQRGDTIYRFNNGVFRVLYNFGAHAGEEWVIDSSTYSYECDSVSKVHVDSTGSTIINGDTLKWISVHPVNSPNVIAGKIYERIGSEYYLLPLQGHCDSAIYEDPVYNFHCYEDSTFPLYNSQMNDCEYMLYVGVENLQHAEPSLSLSPNPASDELTLHSSGNMDGATISVSDALGHVCIRSVVINSQPVINVSSLPAGIYFVEVNNEREKFRSKFVKCK